MLVERIMTSPCTTINEDKTVNDALNLMNEKNIRHLPITDSNMHLKGILSDRDIKLALPSILSNIDPKQTLDAPVTKIMKQQVIQCHPLDFVEDIALDFYNSSIGSIPVVQNKKVIGIVTQKDMLNTFIELTGHLTPGSTIQVTVPDIAGIMHEVTEVFQREKTSIESILVYRDNENVGNKLITIRMKSMQPKFIIDGLIKKGFSVNQPMDNGL